MSNTPSAPTLMAQMPNRKGNVSKHTPSSNTGVTAVTRPQGNLSQPKGAQGAPKATGNVYPSSGKPQVSRPKADYCNNDGYRSSSFLK
jgi:hypothetical protein